MVDTGALYSMMTGLFAAFFLGVLFVSFMVKGFFWSYVKVKMKKNHRVLVKVFSQTETRFYVGKLFDNILVFTDSEKEQRRYTIPQHSLYRTLGVYWVDINGEKNTIYTHEADKEVSGFDPVVYDGLITRALQKPAILTNSTNLLIILLVVLLLLMIGSIFFEFKTYQTIGQLAGQVADLSSKGVV